MWNGNYEKGKMTNQYGEGQILDGYDLSEVFAKLNLPKDVVIADDKPVLWTHRKTAEMDIYFITNQSNKSIELAPVFRVDKNLKPQLWDAVSGEIRVLPDFEITKTGIKVPLKMEAAQSWFMVFENENKTLSKPLNTENFSVFEKVTELQGPFTVDFKNKEIGPAEPVVFNSLKDWSTSENEKIKYYSGSANYTTTFTIDEFAENEELYLNLGNLSVMAKVKLNGKELGGVWIAPYRLNISEGLKKGENQLEIEVVNLWRNQLIKDKQRAEEEKYTWLVIDDIKPKSKLQPSGLLGPVVIESVEY
jgi:hypothetical protein